MDQPPARSTKECSAVTRAADSDDAVWGTAGFRAAWAASQGNQRSSSAAHSEEERRPEDGANIMGGGRGRGRCQPICTGLESCRVTTKGQCPPSQMWLRTFTCCTRGTALRDARIKSMREELPRHLEVAAQ